MKKDIRCDTCKGDSISKEKRQTFATMLKKLTEEIIEDTMAEEVPKLLRDRQDSYLEDLVDTIRLEYRELFLSTAWYLLLSRCGIESWGIYVSGGFSVDHRF